MRRIAGLERPYVQVRRRKNGKVTYGGDQGFFAGAPTDSADSRKQKLGCGIVAFGDMLLYLANGNANYCTKESENYVRRTLSEEEYKTYYNLIYDFMGGIPAKAKNGLSGICLQRKFNRMSRRQNWKLRARWGIHAGKIYSRIVEMLKKDIPVILCIPMVFGKKDKGKGVTFYRKEGERYCKAHSVSAHYVMITGIVEEDEGIFFEISSWGEKYYVSWYEYDTLIHTHFLGTILGNILYIK